MNDIFHTCYYINLDRSPARNKIMIDTYKNLKRIKGVDGIDIQNNGFIKNDALIYKNIIVNGWTKTAKPILFNELGCTLSHLKAIITAYLNNETEIIIMEDDIKCKYINKWNITIQEIINQIPDDADCIQLFCSNTNIINTMLTIKSLFYKWNLNCWSTGIYYINRKGMEKIYNEYYKNNYIILNHKLPVADILIYNKLNTYVYSKPLFNHDSGDSIIHKSHDSLHTNCDKLINYYFTQLS